MEMRIVKFLILLIGLLCLETTIGQVNTVDDIDIKSFRITEKLTNSDPVDAEFGRYDAYEIHLNKGDLFSFVLSSQDFWPIFFVVDPYGNNIIKHPTKGSNTSRIDSTANISGLWTLYG